MKKTKLIPITSLDQLEVGSILVYRNTDKYKVLAKCGLLIWVEQWDLPFQIEHLIQNYQLEVTEEPWMPKEGESYYYPNTFDGTVGINETTWVAGNHGDNLRLKAGLVSKTKEEALAKAQKMLDSIKDSE